MNRGLFLLFGLAVAVLPACNEATGPENAPCKPFLLQYGAAVGDTVTTAEGVRYIDIEAGTGAAARDGDRVLVNYSLYRLDNNVFLESSCGENVAALPFNIGDPSIYTGFSLGVIGMQPGAVRRIILTPDLTQTGAPDLVFDLHLVRVN